MSHNFQPSPFVSNLQNLMAKHGLNKVRLSKQTGISYITLVRLLDGSTANPRADLLDKLSRFFQVPVDALLGIEDKVAQLNPEVIRIQDPVSPRIPLIKWEEIEYWSSQGFNYLGPDHQNWISCNAGMAEDGFGLQVRYEGRGVFPTGSIILIDPVKDYTFEDYVLASINGNKPTIKQIVEEDGALWLLPLGVMVPAEKIGPKNEVVGVIVEYRVIMKS